MDKKITDIFPWQHGPWVDRSAVSASNDVKASNSLSNQMVLCLDRNPSGGDFSFDMMVYSLLAKGSSVILLAFNHPKQHYELILHKNGVNMEKSEQSGQLQFIPMLVGEVFCPDGVDAAASSTPPSATAEITDPCLNDSTSRLLSSLSPHWQPLFRHILSIIGSVPTGTNISVCVDDLLALQLRSTNKQARGFVTALHSLLTSRQIDALVMYGKAYADSECSMVQSESYSQVPSGSIRTEPSSGSDIKTFCTGNSSWDDDQPLYAFCSYRATTCVIISPLSTGYAMDIHGQIMIHSSLSNSDMVVSYKALDSGVSCAIIK